MTIEKTPARKALERKQRKREERDWARKNGPVKKKTTAPLRRSDEYDCWGCGRSVSGPEAVNLRMTAPLGITSIKAHVGCEDAARVKALAEGWRPYEEPAEKPRASVKVKPEPELKAVPSGGKWWLTLAGRKTECLACGTSIPFGETMGYRHEPRAALCQQCVARIGIKAQPSKRLKAPSQLNLGVRVNPSPTTPSPAQITAAMTPGGAWTRRQLAAWGVPWPPPKGWRKRLEREYLAKQKAPAA